MKKVFWGIICCLSLFMVQAQERVVRIIDGDTFELSTGEKIRLIGINAPEIKEKYGFESKKYLNNLIGNKEVFLKNDPIAKNKDIFGRLLRYVYYKNEDVNKRIVRDGYAKAYLKYPFKNKVEYSEAELLAKNDELGIWQIEETGAIVKNTKYYVVGFGVLVLFVFLFYYLRK